MGKALYRKYRSTSLADVLGQGHITDVLRRALEADKIAHAYLLTGPRGVGKTSIARILAHEINKLPYDGTEHLDIIEIDAASNNGVDDVRDLREKARLAPVSAPKKIYIIDEVHMLSKPAFNALLKTLEEPPEHVIFILATTDAQKLPETIRSRTQTYHFRSITPSDIANHLRTIADKEGITITDDALAQIAEHGRGSFRDSIGMLDQLGSSNQDITVETVESVLGLAPQGFIDDLLAVYRSGDANSANQRVRELEDRGLNPVVIADQLATAARNSLATTPDLLPLLQRLPEVARSSMPAVSLLLALSSNTSTEPFNQQSERTASGTLLAHGGKSEVQPESPAESGETPRETPSAKERVAEVVSEQKKATTKKSEPKKKSIVKARTKNQKDFPWTDVLNNIKTQSVALYSLLEKRTHTFDGETLTIYAVNAFNKKKLDDKKYSQIWHGSLEKVGLGETTINTLPTTSPPSDPALAKVAAMMGGGEEVNIED